MDTSILLSLILIGGVVAFHAWARWAERRAAARARHAYIAQIGAGCRHPLPDVEVRRAHE